MAVNDDDHFVGPCEACGRATLRAAAAVWSEDGRPFCRGCLPTGDAIADMHAALRPARPAMRRTVAEYLCGVMVGNDPASIASSEWDEIRPDLKTIAAAEACVGRVPDDWPWMDAIIDSGAWREQP